MSSRFCNINVIGPTLGDSADHRPPPNVRRSTGTSIPSYRELRIAGCDADVRWDFRKVTTVLWFSEEIIGPRTSVDAIVLVVNRSKLNDVSPPVLQRCGIIWIDVIWIVAIRSVVGNVELAASSRVRGVGPEERIVDGVGRAPPPDLVVMVWANIPLNQDAAVVFPQFNVARLNWRFGTRTIAALSQGLFFGWERSGYDSEGDQPSRYDYRWCGAGEAMDIQDRRTV